ncbi:retrovirus-related Pol polyprotein from transposon TNT 1-94 [Trichonephila clavata]|uniref:Retrovirus-related Pol polyprotein from transposon TNT 1-94 n=1 Tax=Trichonephila clavata TaxID=2740835 RepID=A0A8X6LCU7_TRICU|nr:retrovirus-related Pol polyprotein from transposon TNT 1-94 [Trichonephila clavata]
MEFKAHIEKLVGASNWSKWKRQIELLLRHHDVHDVCRDRECPRLPAEASAEAIAAYEKAQKTFVKDYSLAQLILVGNMDDSNAKLTSYVLPRQTNTYNCGMKDCHQNKAHVKDILRKYQIKRDAKDSQICDGCCYGKQSRRPFGTRKQRATTPGELINTDVCGPMQQQSLGGAKYYVCFKDDFTKYRRVFFMQSKNEVSKCLETFLNEAKNTGHMIKEVLSDGGGEITQYLSLSLSADVPYREAVGSLMFLAIVTRPDIAYAVGVLSQVLDKPQQIHWTMLKRILRYLNGTKKCGIMYLGVTSATLESYSDSDYAGDPLTRRSTSGMVFKAYTSGGQTFLMGATK